MCLRSADSSSKPAQAQARVRSTVTALGDPVQFSLEERSNQVKASSHTYTFGSKINLVPNGQLTFRIREYWPEIGRKTWSDGTKQQLEEQVNDIIPAIVETSLAVKEQRLKREQIEEARRKQRELPSLTV
jgi:hypothetical protein